MFEGGQSVDADDTMDYIYYVEVEKPTYWAGGMLRKTSTQDFAVLR
jgi:hypothetical protein